MLGAIIVHVASSDICSRHASKSWRCSVARNSSASAFESVTVSRPSTRNPRARSAGQTTPFAKRRP